MAKFATCPVQATDCYNDVICHDVDVSSISAKIAKHERFAECRDRLCQIFAFSDQESLIGLKEFEQIYKIISTWRLSNGVMNTKWGSLVEKLKELNNPALMQDMYKFLLTKQQPDSEESDTPMECSDSDADERAVVAEESTDTQDSENQRLSSGIVCLSENKVFPIDQPPCNIEVSRDVDRMVPKFARLVRMTYSTFTDLDVPIDDVTIYLSELSASQREEIPCFDTNMSEIITYSTYKALFVFLARIGAWNFLNYHLLAKLIEEYGNDNLKGLLAEYEKEIEGFKFKTKLADFLPIWSGRIRSDSVPKCSTVMITLNQSKWKDYTLAGVERHLGYVGGQFHLNKLCLNLSNGKPGSVTLFLLLPKSVADCMQRMMKEAQQPLLDRMTIAKIVIDNKAYPIKHNYEVTRKNSIENPEVFWSDKANEYLVWDEPFHTADNCNIKEAKIDWFVGGKLNICYNCLDRHAAETPDRIAIIWEKDEQGQHEKFTYKQLLDQTCRIANVLQRKGVQKGDRVMIYMPAMPSAVASMLACARIGAVHCVSYPTADKLNVKQYIAEIEAKVVITADDLVVGGKPFELKENIDYALEEATKHSVHTVLVANRNGRKPPMKKGRDYYLEEEMEKQSTDCPLESMKSEDELFIIYTSGTSGKPTGIVHTQAGYTLSAAMNVDFFYKPGGILACVCDLGWITGHTCVVYGPLCIGGTSVLFESIPSYPDYNRYWEMIDRLKVTHFGTMPFALESVRENMDMKEFEKYDLSSLRLIATIGEPLSDELMEWYSEVIGKNRCAVLDGYSQTELGGAVILRWTAPDKFPLPPYFPTEKTFAFYGVDPCFGKGQQSEVLYLKKATPAMGRAFIGEKKGEFKQLFSKGMYCTNDWAVEENNSFRIKGRTDDVVRIKGVRVDIPKIESAVKASDERIEESAIVGFPLIHQKTKVDTEFIYVALVLKMEVKEEENSSVIEHVTTALVELTDDTIKIEIEIKASLPKTDNGKKSKALIKFFAIAKLFCVRKTRSDVPYSVYALEAGACHEHEAHPKLKRSISVWPDKPTEPAKRRRTLQVSYSEDVSMH